MLSFNKALSYKKKHTRKHIQEPSILMLLTTSHCNIVTLNNIYILNLLLTVSFPIKTFFFILTRYPFISCNVNKRSAVEKKKKEQRMLFKA